MSVNANANANANTNTNTNTNTSSQAGPAAGPSLPGNEDYRYGIDLFNAEYFWEAHAVWEEIWMAADDEPTRTLLQGLIQLAAACLKRDTDEPAGAKKLFASARSRLGRVAESGPLVAGIDLRELLFALEREPKGAIHIALEPE